MWSIYHCQRNVKIDAYQTYVRPILEYAVTAWAPYTQRNIKKIESIQRWAARFVLSDFSTYSSVTVMLSRSTLHHRRHILKLTMLFKMLHNLVELSLPNYITYNTSTTRGHKYKLSIPFSRVDVYKHSFFPSTIPKWNSLSASNLCWLICWFALTLLHSLYEFFAIIKIKKGGGGGHLS